MHPSSSSPVQKSQYSECYQYYTLPMLTPPTPIDMPIKLPSLIETFPEFFAKTQQVHQQQQQQEQQYQNKEVSDDYFNHERRSYSFIALAERDRKPRPRRRFEEVERLYKCVHPQCNKAYGALNHLNSHIVSKGHGMKRSPQEFQEMRRAIKLRQQSQLAYLLPPLNMYQ